MKANSRCDALKLGWDTCSRPMGRFMPCSREKGLIVLGDLLRPTLEHVGGWRVRLYSKGR